MKISVVMTTYNGERYLQEQIESILSQDLTPDEFIVSDDCSTDGTVAILESYKREGMLRYETNISQLGLIGNFKKAVSLAAVGNCIALSDQDDFWLPNKLSVSAAYLEKMNNSSPCMVHTDLAFIDQNDLILNDSFRAELRQAHYQHNLQTLLFSNFVTGCTVLMNPRLREYFLEMPLDVKFHDAWIALVAFVFGSVEELSMPLVKYRKHDLNLSFAHSKKPKSRILNLLLELSDSIKGKNDFLALQFETAAKFYDQYNKQMSSENQKYFEKFLRLRNLPYILKKMAYGLTIRKFPLPPNYAVSRS